MAKFIPLAVVLSVVVGAATYVHGVVTERWRPADNAKLQEFTERIPGLPLNIGDWQGTDEFISDKEFALTGCTAYISRRYVHRESGETMSLYVVSGTHRNITRHSPDWCYQGAGYKMEATPVQHTIDCGPSLPASPEFLTAVFRKRDLVDSSRDQILRIFWTYADDGVWQGPAWAEMSLAGKLALYKIYLIAQADDRDTSAEASPCIGFAQEAFPVINRILFPAAAERAEGIGEIDAAEGAERASGADAEGAVPAAEPEQPLDEDLILD